MPMAFGCGLHATGQDGTAWDSFMEPCTSNPGHSPCFSVLCHASDAAVPACPTSAGLARVQAAAVSAVLLCEYYMLTPPPSPCHALIRCEGLDGHAHNMCPGYQGDDSWMGLNCKLTGKGPSDCVPKQNLQAIGDSRTGTSKSRAPSHVVRQVGCFKGHSQLIAAGAFECDVGLLLLLLLLRHTTNNPGQPHLRI